MTMARSSGWMRISGLCGDNLLVARSLSMKK